MSDILNRVETALNDCNYKYNTVQNFKWYEYHILTELPYDLFLRVSPRLEFVRIHNWIALEKETVTEKWTSLLNFCNITSRNCFLKAILYPDGIDISYIIPDGAGDALGRLIINVLYDFFMYFDHDLLSKALETDEDLYLYEEEKIKKDMEESKNRYKRHIESDEV